MFGHAGMQTKKQMIQAKEMNQMITAGMPKIGMRIIKSSAAIFLCFLFYGSFRRDGILFYSQLAALWCIQPYMQSTKSKALQRTVGTMVGGLFGLAVLLIDQNLIQSVQLGNLLYSAIVSLAIIAVIYLTLLIHKRDASYFSCVVFLSIVVNHIEDANSYLFVFNRVLDTMIGIGIAMFVNVLHFPRRKEKDILFISGVDDTLLEANEKPASYSMVELNRMIDDGAHFTISTKQTPDSLMELLRGVRLNLPIIAMDGAVVYDINNHEYLCTCVISLETANTLLNFLKQYDINYFVYMLLDHMLLVWYRELKNPAERDIYDKLHVSPYQNYTQHNLLEDSKCICFMMIDTREKIKEIYDDLCKTEFVYKLRIVTYDSDDYPGYAYIKIYNRNATRENMIEYLKQTTGLERIVTFGSIHDKYDNVIEGYDHSKVTRTLKKMYEPPIWSRRLK